MFWVKFYYGIFTLINILFGSPRDCSYIYGVKVIKVMEIVREFTCALTGEHVRIVCLPDGNKIALGENEELGKIEF